MCHQVALHAARQRGNVNEDNEEVEYKDESEIETNGEKLNDESMMAKNKQNYN